MRPRDLEIARHEDHRRRSQHPLIGLRPRVGAKRVGDFWKEFCREEGWGQALVGREKKGILVGFSKYLDVLAHGWDDESEFPNRASHFPC